MRLVRVYLIVYYLLVAGAAASLWSGGVLQQLPVSWTLIGLAVAVGLGILLAVSAATTPD